MQDQILAGYLGSFVKEHELQSLPEDEQFEHFVNYCVLSSVYPGSVSLDSVHTGTATGIDGVLVLVNDYPVTTLEELGDLIAQRVEARFTFIQAKRSPTFDLGELLKFLNAVETFFVADVSASSPRLDAVKALKDQIYKNAAKMDDPPECEMYFVTTGRWSADKTLDQAITKTISTLNSLRMFSRVRFNPVDAQHLRSLFMATRHRVTKTIKFEKHTILPKINGVDQAFIGILPGTEYLKLLVDQDGGILKTIFYDNVRDFQGNNAVNLEIAGAIQDKASLQDRFLLLNNGVTVVAKSIRQVGDQFTLKDYQVVNGCQTSHVMFLNKDRLTDQIFVPIKLIATADQEVSSQIVKGTNRQNVVGIEAFEALEPFHKELEEYYASVSDPSSRLFYERRSKQYEADDIPKTRIISVPNQTKCFVAMWLDEPHNTVRHYSKLLEEYREVKVFNEQHEPVAYYVSALALVVVERLIRDGRLAGFFRSFKYHLLSMIRWEVQRQAAVQATFLRRKETKALCEEIRKRLVNQADAEALVSNLARHISIELKAFGMEPNEAALRREFTSRILARTKGTPKVAPAETATTQVAPASNRRLGTVKRWGTWGYGFISDSEGQDYFAHIYWVQDRTINSLQKGQRVEFAAARNVKGLIARDIVVVK